MKRKGWEPRGEQFDEFVAEVRTRMEQGHREYGDESFSRDPTDLTKEISEEITDIMGWAFILWTRLQSIQNRLEEDDGNIS
jgi:hypothetical protein